MSKEIELTEPCIISAQFEIQRLYEENLKLKDEIKNMNNEEFKREFSDKLSKFITDDITKLVSKVIEKRVRLVVDEISNNLVGRIQQIKEEPKEQ